MNCFKCSNSKSREAYDLASAEILLACILSNESEIIAMSKFIITNVSKNAKIARMINWPTLKVS